jgi:hypothetical protein
MMGWFIGAGLRKSIADVTQRKWRTLLVVLGIFIGIFGLTAINTAEDSLFAAINFTLSAQPRSRTSLWLSITSIRRFCLICNLSLMSRRYSTRQYSTRSGTSARHRVIFLYGSSVIPISNMYHCHRFN